MLAFLLHCVNVIKLDVHAQVFKTSEWEQVDLQVGRRGEDEGRLGGQKVVWNLGFKLGA
jgi:hypothetical protein